jgi:hypothetical protein
MYLIVRTCSIYTDDDIMMGVFSTYDLAQTAKREYICELERNGDPHKDQGYMDVCLEKDIHITKIEVIHGEKDPSSNVVYILQEQSEGFGQVCRKIKRISWCLVDIVNKVKNYPAPEEETFPSCYLYNALEIDHLYFENSDTYIHT